MEYKITFEMCFWWDQIKLNPINPLRHGAGHGQSLAGQDKQIKSKNPSKTSATMLSLTIFSPVCIYLHSSESALKQVAELSGW